MQKILGSFSFIELLILAIQKIEVKTKKVKILEILMFL